MIKVKSEYGIEYDECGDITDHVLILSAYERDIMIEEVLRSRGDSSENHAAVIEFINILRELNPGQLIIDCTGI